MTVTFRDRFQFVALKLSEVGLTVGPPDSALLPSVTDMATVTAPPGLVASFAVKVAVLPSSMVKAPLRENRTRGVLVLPSSSLMRNRTRSRLSTAS